jgi:hypothetical protein
VRHDVPADGLGVVLGEAHSVWVRHHLTREGGRERDIGQWVRVSEKITCVSRSFSTDRRDTYIHTYIYTYIQTNIHIFIHIYIHKKICGAVKISL